MCFPESDDLERQRRPLDEFLHHDLVARGLKSRPSAAQVGGAARHRDPLAPARPARLDHDRISALRPRQRARKIDLGEQPVGTQLRGRQRIRGQVKQEGHAPVGKARVEPLQCPQVLTRGQDGVAGREQAPGARFVGRDIEPVELVGQARRGNVGRPIHQNHLVSGLPGQVCRLRALQPPPYDAQPHGAVRTCRSAGRASASQASYSA